MKWDFVCYCHWMQNMFVFHLVLSANDQLPCFSLSSFQNVLIVVYSITTKLCHIFFLMSWLLSTCISINSKLDILYKIFIYVSILRHWPWFYCCVDKVLCYHQLHLWLLFSVSVCVNKAIVVLMLILLSLLCWIYFIKWQTKLSKTELLGIQLNTLSPEQTGLLKTGNTEKSIFDYLAPVRFEWNFSLVIDGWSISCEVAWMNVTGPYSW